MPTTTLSSHTISGETFNGGNPIIPALQRPVSPIAPGVRAVKVADLEPVDSATGPRHIWSPFRAERLVTRFHGWRVMVPRLANSPDQPLGLASRTLVGCCLLLG